MNDIPPDTASKGYGAYISAIMSAVALIAAAHPSWRWFVFVRDHAADVVNIAPYILGPLGVVGGMISHPPAWLRTHWDAAKARIRAKVAPKVTS